MWESDNREGWAPTNFKLWCWRSLLRVPWIARSNLSILKEINPEYSLEGLMLRLKFQYFGHLMRRTDSFEKTLRMGKIEGGRKRGRQRCNSWMASPTKWTWVWVNSGRWWWTGRPGMLWFMGAQRVRHDWVTELNWTDFLSHVWHLFSLPSHFHGEIDADQGKMEFFFLLCSFPPLKT